MCKHVWVYVGVKRLRIATLVNTKFTKFSNFEHEDNVPDDVSRGALN